MSEERGFKSYREPIIDWHPNTPDVDELIRYNRLAKQASCEHKKTMTILQSWRNGESFITCADCGY